jgi:hypothetical protein
LQRGQCSAQAEPGLPRDPRGDANTSKLYEKVAYSVMAASPLLIPIIFKIHAPLFLSIHVVYLLVGLYWLWTC